MDITENNPPRYRLIAAQVKFGRNVMAHLTGGAILTEKKSKFKYKCNIDWKTNRPILSGVSLHMIYMA